MSDTFHDYIALAERLADAAGKIVLRYFRTQVEIDDKADLSPVTIADREAERAMRDIIAKAFPDHGVIGEEHGADRPGASHVWVLDPIDGTKSFITGRPLFGSLVALCRDGKPLIGVIDCPAAKERWIGASGRPTLHQGKPVRTRACASIHSAAVSCTSPLMFKPDDFARFERVRKAARTPVYGGDCYGYGLVASGFTDLVIEADLKLYDYAAIVPIIEGAGGVMTDWQGKALGAASDGRVIAAGDARTHLQAVRLLG